MGLLECNSIDLAICQLFSALPGQHYGVPLPQLSAIVP